MTARGKRSRPRGTLSADPRISRITAKLLLVVAPLICVVALLAYPHLFQKWDIQHEDVPEYGLGSYVWVLAGPAGFLVFFQALGLFLLAYAVWTLVRVGWSKSPRDANR